MILAIASQTFKKMAELTYVVFVLYELSLAQFLKSQHLLMLFALAVARHIEGHVTTTTPTRSDS